MTKTHHAIVPTGTKPAGLEKQMKKHNHFEPLLDRAVSWMSSPKWVAIASLYFVSKYPEHPKSEDKIDDAVSAFSSLNEKQQKSVLKYVRFYLGYSAFMKRYDSVTKLADFCARASDSLDINDGEKLNSSFNGVMKTLKKIIERTDGTTSGVAEMQLACAKALWALDYGSAEFWICQLYNPAVSAYIAKEFLNLTPDVHGYNFSGWKFLKDALYDSSDLPTIALAIANSGSLETSNFLLHIMSKTQHGTKGQEETNIKHALFIASHLDEISEDFRKAVGALEGKLHDHAEDMFYIVDRMPDIENGGFKESKVALEIIRKCGCDLGVKSHSGVLTRIAEKTQRIVDAVASDEFDDKGKKQCAEYVLAIIDAVSNNGHANHLVDVIDDMLSKPTDDGRLLLLSEMDFDEKHFGILPLIIENPSQGKIDLLNYAITSNNAFHILNGFNTISAHSSITPQFCGGDTIAIAYGVLGGTFADAKMGALRYLSTLTVQLAENSNSSDQDEFDSASTHVAGMLTHNDHRVIGFGLTIAGGFAEIPDEFTEVVSRLSDATKQKIGVNVDDFLTIAKLRKELVTHAGAERAATAARILGLYTPKKPHLSISFAPLIPQMIGLFDSSMGNSTKDLGLYSAQYALGRILDIAQFDALHGSTYLMSRLGQSDVARNDIKIGSAIHNLLRIYSELRYPEVAFHTVETLDVVTPVALPAGAIWPVFMDDVKNIPGIMRLAGRSTSQGKFALALDMIHSDDPRTIEIGFKMALQFGEVPKSVGGTLQRLCDSDNETVNPLALRYVDLRQQLELAIPKLHLAGDSQFDGVKELVDLHFKGVNVDHYLEMAESEMKDVLMEPGGETDEQRTNAQIKAISMLQKLASTGTGKPLRVQLVDESRHLTTLIPMHPELHKLITDPNVPSDLLEAANDAIKETLKQLRGGEE